MFANIDIGDKFQEWILTCIDYLVVLVWVLFISIYFQILRENWEPVKKKRNVRDFCKGNVRHLTYRKHSERNTRVIK
jgi:hypothetical protein